MPAPKELTKNEVVDWINYYEQGNTLPDDILVRILFMAKLYSEQHQSKHFLLDASTELEHAGFKGV